MVFSLKEAAIACKSPAADLYCSTIDSCKNPQSLVNLFANASFADSLRGICTHKLPACKISIAVPSILVACFCKLHGSSAATPKNLCNHRLPVFIAAPQILQRTCHHKLAILFAAPLIDLIPLRICNHKFRV
jgi:hypothetical protein